MPCSYCQSLHRHSARNILGSLCRFSGYCHVLHTIWKTPSRSIAMAGSSHALNSSSWVSQSSMRSFPIVWCYLNCSSLQMFWKCCTKSPRDTVNIEWADLLLTYRQIQQLWEIHNYRDFSYCEFLTQLLSLANVWEPYTRSGRDTVKIGLCLASTCRQVWHHSTMDLNFCSLFLQRTLSRGNIASRSAQLFPVKLKCYVGSGLYTVNFIVNKVNRKVIRYSPC